MLFMYNKHTLQYANINFHIAADDVRNYLYRRVYLNETTGLDLAAASITRGRDHAFPGYTYYLAYLFNITVHTFDDLRKMLPDKSVDLLEELYE